MCRPASFDGADGAHHLAVLAVEGVGFAGWRIGYMVYPEHARVRDGQESRTRS